MNLRQNYKRPLLQCNPIHQLHGRMRIYCRALKFLSDHKKDIEELLLSVHFISSVKISPITSNVLIYYSDEFDSKIVLRKVEDIISQFSIPAFKGERKEKSRLTVNERRLQEEPVEELFRNVLVGSAALAWALFKRNTTPARSMFGRLTNFTALTSLSLARPVFKSGYESLRYNKRPNADTLSAVSILASLLSGNGISSLTIILLSDIAELLTAYSMNRTRKAIRAMLATGEKFVWKLEQDGSLIKTPQEEIHKGDTIVVHSGEIISVDGKVINGSATVDDSSITGEYMPKEKSKGDYVFAGSTIKTGTVSIMAEQTQEDTAASKIIHMVEEASHNKAQVQNVADKFSGSLIPLNFILGGIVYAVTKSPMRALNMLVIDYSCSIRLSTATALTAAISTGARNKVLIKGSNYLETLAEVDTVIFDKTGTLTEGNPEVKSIIPVDEKLNIPDLLGIVAAAEETSTHPVAHAIMQRVKLNGIKIPKHNEIEVVIGRGVKTKIGRSIVRVGNAKFMKENGILLEPAKDIISRLMLRGENIVYVSKSNKLCGLIGLNDPLRENMKKTINRLRNLEVDDIILLTGDVEQQAEVVASKMTFDRYKSELMPEDKARFALNLQSKGSKVVMIGDGINDAPALAYADVGIALGSKRTDIAMEAADIAIQSDNPLTIPSAIQLSRRTMQTVQQNFIASIGINSLGLVLGATGLLPVFWGAFLHNMTTVAVVSNSLRLFFFKMER
ncbi:heavy metal translocating P-type ATPase [Marinifilum caeruleilacunae]|uniref:P-type Zn(2+) transporter n=1 Tax=Marinifilum caeruleilacunae TaxID=2499076 RepID=A0ABX1WX62_9BACT|nr:heavy metal translocating P-type ATPase [Marinifilum caeruleilacunae]NOU60715.1 heavy metal translocating P-type ATPase [Marinifilum caeruleilacunae]